MQEEKQQVLNVLALLVAVTQLTCFTSTKAQILTHYRRCSGWSHRARAAAGFESAGTLYLLLICFTCCWHALLAAYMRCIESARALFILLLPTAFYRCHHILLLLLRTAFYPPHSNAAHRILMLRTALYSCVPHSTIYIYIGTHIHRARLQHAHIRTYIYIYIYIYIYTYIHTYIHTHIYT